MHRLRTWLSGAVDILERLARNVRRLRMEKGWSQERYAFEADVHRTYVSDIERGRRLELPWLSAAVVRIGREVGVPTPIHQFITTILTPFVNGKP